MKAPKELCNKTVEYNQISVKKAFLESQIKKADAKLAENGYVWYAGYGSAMEVILGKEESL